MCGTEWWFHKKTEDKLQWVHRFLNTCNWDFKVENALNLVVWDNVPFTILNRKNYEMGRTRVLNPHQWICGETFIVEKRIVVELAV